jgi:hypothetical protein
VRTSEVTKADLPAIYEDAFVVECTVDEARALEVSDDLLATTIDNAQGTVFGEAGKVAWLVIRIAG